MSLYDVSDLEMWGERVREKVEAFGLSCYPQEFELCDHNAMLGYMAYSGMPSRYPHWSYGKAFEKLKTLYDYGISGLPYEMVINSNPALAYLMKDNSLLLQILTIAHVYGHNDFFKNNFTFKSTTAAYIAAQFKAHAMRVRKYLEDPSIGIDKVEPVLDAAHALSLQCRRNLAIRKLSEEEARARALEEAQPKYDPLQVLHQRDIYAEPDLRKVPLIPDEDLLLFIRDHNPYLSEWERDLLTIVHEEAQYFIPQIETKIMNEGWASWWHKKIIDSLQLPQDLYMEFIVRHNQVVRPHHGGINPYHLGIKLWEDIERKGGDKLLFAVRETDRDVAFLRRHLTEELIRELDLFEYAPQEKGDDLIVTSVSDKEGWEQVKETLIRTVGMSTIPIIKVHDADFGGNRALFLVHEHDGRDLDVQNTEKSLEHAHRLWGRTVVLETISAQKKVHCAWSQKGFSVQEQKKGK